MISILETSPTPRSFAMAEFDQMYLSARLEGLEERFDKESCLMDVAITLGQQSLSSTVSVTLADPDGKIADKLITHSLQNGGIPVVKDPTQSNDSPQVSTTGGTQNADTSLNPQRRAFLDLIAWCEGTSGADGYKMMFTGKIFNDYKDHPRQLQSGGGYTSDAAGRYQFLSTTWDGVKGRAGVGDFSPTSQDKGCVVLLQEIGVLAQIDNGQIQSAIEGSKTTWTSLPGASQNYGKTMPECVAYYQDRLKIYQGGNITPSQKTELKKESSNAPDNQALEAVKGNRLVVQWSDYVFEFFHQATDYDFLAGKTVLSGVGIRWVLNRRPRNKTFQNKTFRDIAQQVAANQGLKLDYQATYDVYYEYVSQDGISDYQLLKREAERAGLVLSESSTTLIVKSLQNLQDTAIVLEYQNNVISLVTQDKAVDSTSQDFGTWTAQTVGSKIDIDAITGKMVQTKADIDPTKSKDVTGAAAKQPTGKLQPGTEQAIDKAQAKYKRVRGLPTTVVIPLSDETLGIQPMQAVRTRGFSPFLNRVWVVDSVAHSWSAATTTLSLYTAVSVKDEGNVLNVGGVVDPNIPPGDFMYPVHGFPVTDLAGYSEWRGRNHAGTDIGCPLGTPVQASSDGVVSHASPQGTYGNLVRIQHNGEYETGYAHLDSIGVRVGQKVRKGEVIGASGNTGGGLSTGEHLHWEIFKGNQMLTPGKVGLQEAFKGMTTP